MNNSKKLLIQFLIIAAVFLAPSTAQASMTVTNQYIASVYSSSSKESNRTVRNIVHEKPKGVTACNDLNGVCVTWDSSPNTDQYRIYRRSCSVEGELIEEWSSFADVNGNEYLDTNVNSGSVYEYKVCCLEGTKEVSSLSDVSGVVQYLAAPEEIKVEYLPDAVEISWEPTTGADAYRIYRAEVITIDVEGGSKTDTVKGDANLLDGDMGLQSVALEDNTEVEIQIEPDTAIENKVILADTTDCVYVDSEVESGKSYVYFVCCINAETNQETSACDKEGVFIRFCMAPTKVELSNDYQGIKLKWSQVDGAPGYVILKSKDGIQWSELQQIANTEYIDTQVFSTHTYQYRIFCYDNENNTILSGYDVNEHEITYYSSPGTVQFTNEQDGIKIVWSKTANITSYRVNRKNKDTWEFIAVTDTNEYLDKEVKSGSEYIYSIECLDESATNAVSGFNLKGFSTTFYSAPANVKLKNTQKGVQISWDSVEGIENYRVFSFVDGKWKRLQDTKELKYVDENALSNKNNKYTVAAISTEGTRIVSGKSENGFEICYIEAPRNIELKNQVAGIHISWNPSEGVNKYRVLIKDSEGKWQTLGDTEKNEYVDKNVKGNKTYTYSVKCLDDKGKNAISAYDSKGVSLLRLDPVLAENITIKNTKTGAEVKWEEIKGADGYYIYCREEEGDYAKIGSVDAQTLKFVDKNAAQGTLLYYSVRAKKTVDQKEILGSYSGKKNVYVNPVDRLDAVPIIKGLNLSWENHYWIAGYQIQYGTDSKFADNTKTMDVGYSSSEYLRDLKIKDYYVRIRAYCIKGDKKYYSAWTNVSEKVRPLEEPKFSYIVNKNTNVFHEEWCRDVRKMKEKNKRYVTDTRTNMVNKHKPCGHCNP